MITGGHVGLGLFSRRGRGASSGPIDPPAGRPTLPWPRLSGVARMGETLTVEAPALTNIQSYQWFLDDVEMTEASGASFTPGMMGHVSAIVTADEGVFTAPIVQVTHAHHMGDHGITEDAVLALAPHVSASHIAVQDGLWSDPMTWDVGSVPGEGAVVLVPIGVNVTYDVAASPRLDRLRLDGALRVALDQSTQMHVETITIPPTGLLEIGAGFESRLPGQYAFDLIISDRAYAVSPNGSADLDFELDPFLLGRGIICLGNFVVFGDERKRHIKTALGSAPLSGDSFITLAQAPIDWRPGDEIMIPGTTVEVQSVGTNDGGPGPTTIFDERRTITSIVGNVVNFAGPLVYDHDHQNAAVTRNDLQPTIANVTTNVTVRSESTDTQRRGHIMVMHDGFSDVWDLGVKDMGRTDTTGEPGNVLAGGMFEYFDQTSQVIEKIAMQVGANSRGRYPFHFHFCGFNRSEVPNLHNSVVDGSPGWGVVHHGCEADIFDNTVFGWSGSGMVAETGNETGPWVRNLVFGCDNRVNASYSSVKTVDGLQRGLRGDFARHGVAYYFRGRAVRTVDNVAASSPTGYTFFHRTNGGAGGNLAQHIPVDRATTDVNDIHHLNLLHYDTIEVKDHPISHFTRNEAFGCFHGWSATKTDPEQGHDIMTQLRAFKAWACVRAMTMEYLGVYLIEDLDGVSTDANVKDYAFWKIATGQGLSLNGNTAQMTITGLRVEGFHVGLRLDGSLNTNLNFSNDDFDNVGNPRFIVNEPTYINCTTDISLESQHSVGQIKTTAEVTQIYPLGSPAPTLPVEPVITLPFIVADWDGSSTLNSSTNYTNVQSGTKVDSVGTQPIPKTWDEMMIAQQGWTVLALREYATRYGYWSFDAENIIVVHQYHSHRITARPVRKAQAYRVTQTGNNIIDRGLIPYNGEWPAPSANPPQCTDLTATVSAGGSVTIDVAANTTDADGAGPFTLAKTQDGPVYFGPASGRATLDPDGGIVTYRPDFGYTGPDEFFVWVTNGTGLYDTVKIDVTVS